MPWGISPHSFWTCASLLQLVRWVLEDFGPRLKARHVGVLVLFRQSLPTLEQLLGQEQPAHRLLAVELAVAPQPRHRITVRRGHDRGVHARVGLARNSPRIVCWR